MLYWGTFEKCKLRVKEILYQIRILLYFNVKCVMALRMAIREEYKRNSGTRDWGGGDCYAVNI